MPKKYTERLKLPIKGIPAIDFSTPNGLLIARGYQQVIFHKKTPYIEFKETNINKENIYIPDSQKWRIKNPSSLFVEYRSKDYCNVKIMHWKSTNCLKSDMFYISPFDLQSDQIPVLIDPLRRKKSTMDAVFKNQEA
jgi:hypothetical protein